MLRCKSLWLVWTYFMHFPSTTCLMFFFFVRAWHFKRKVGQKTTTIVWDSSCASMYFNRSSILLHFIYLCLEANSIYLLFFSFYYAALFYIYIYLFVCQKTVINILIIGFSMQKLYHITRIANWLLLPCNNAPLIWPARKHSKSSVVIVLHNFAKVYNSIRTNEQYKEKPDLKSAAIWYLYTPSVLRHVSAVKFKSNISNTKEKNVIC